MAIFGSDSTGQAVQVQQSAGQRLGNLRQAAYSVRDICNWAVNQQAADLVSIGFSAADAATLQAKCGNILALLNYAEGGSVPAAEAGFNFFDDARDVIGPQ